MAWVRCGLVRAMVERQAPGGGEEPPAPPAISLWPERERGKPWRFTHCRPGVGILAVFDGLRVELAGEVDKQVAIWRKVRASFIDAPVKPMPAIEAVAPHVPTQDLDSLAGPAPEYDADVRARGLQQVKARSGSGLHKTLVAGRAYRSASAGAATRLLMHASEASCQEPCQLQCILGTLRATTLTTSKPGRSPAFDLRPPTVPVHHEDRGDDDKRCTPNWKQPGCATDAQSHAESDADEPQHRINEENPVDDRLHAAGVPRCRFTQFGHSLIAGWPSGPTAARSSACNARWTPATMHTG